VYVFGAQAVFEITTTMSVIAVAESVIAVDASPVVTT
jgi:hypothetical protein